MGGYESNVKKGHIGRKARQIDLSGTFIQNKYCIKKFRRTAKTGILSKCNLIFQALVLVADPWSGPKRLVYPKELLLFFVLFFYTKVDSIF